MTERMLISVAGLDIIVYKMTWKGSCLLGLKQLCHGFIELNGVNP
jgi:hypothetical protein